MTSDLIFQIFLGLRLFEHNGYAGQISDHLLLGIKVEGHVMVIYKAKQIYMLPNGEKRAGVAVNTMELNPKMNQFSVKGVGWVVDKDGDKVMRVHEGQPVGENHWKGTYTYTGGTGKFEGVKGSGTWDSYSMGQGQASFLDIVGEEEIPKQ